MVTYLTCTAAILTPIAAFFGTYISAKFAYKSKLAEIQAHTDENIKEAFTNRLDSMDASLEEIKRQQLKTCLTVSQLQTDVQKHNSVIERTYKLEQQMAVVEIELKNLKHA